MPITLALMMKNEAANLPRSLASVKPLIDAYVITDTGSTDNSVEVAHDILEGIPGEIRHTPWKDWGYNRTDAIQAALKRSENNWAFILDADEEVHDLPLRNLTLDPKFSYWITIHFNGTNYDRPNIISSAQEWEYIGVTHEYLWSKSNPQNVKLPGYIETLTSRCTKTPEKCAADAVLLEEALKTDPDNHRYWFYLAQSYRDSGQIEKGIAAYRKRIELGGWPEECFISQLRIAQMMSGRYPLDQVIAEYVKAWKIRPERMGEAMRNLSRYTGWLADHAKYPEQDRLFVDTSAYGPRAQN